MATIRDADDFDAEAAATTVKEAMRGIGTDEDDIIAIVTGYSNAQRQEIKEQFETKYGQDIEDELKSELNSVFEDAVLALFESPRKYDAIQLHDAMSGGGTTENTLVEILITRSNEELEEIKEIYKADYDTELVKDVKDDTSGYIKRLFFAQCNAHRTHEHEGVNEELAENDAREIFEAGEDQMGTDEAVISGVLCLRSWSQLRRTFEEYERISEKSIEDAIGSECSGSLKDAYMTIIDFANYAPKCFARRAYESMKGAGTDDNALIRIIVSRSEIDLAYIKDAFQDLYGQSLSDFVADDCGGDYKKLLLRIIEGN